MGILRTQAQWSWSGPGCAVIRKKIAPSLSYPLMHDFTGQQQSLYTVWAGPSTGDGVYTMVLYISLAMLSHLLYGLQNGMVLKNTLVEQNSIQVFCLLLLQFGAADPILMTTSCST